MPHAATCNGHVVFVCFMHVWPEIKGGLTSLQSPSEFIAAELFASFSSFEAGIANRIPSFK